MKKFLSIINLSIFYVATIVTAYLLLNLFIGNSLDRVIEGSHIIPAWFLVMTIVAMLYMSVFMFVDACLRKESEYQFFWAFLLFVMPVLSTVLYFVVVYLPNSKVKKI